MIDAEKVKAFWENRAAKMGEVAFESIVNLEEDQEALAEKIRVEKENVFKTLGDVTGKSILDLGAGIGQWAFRFVEHGAKHVTAVEYAANLVRIGREEAKRRDVSCIDFIESPAEKFTSAQRFDIVFISGLFVYLNDDQVEELMPHLREMTAHSGVVVLRDGTGVPERHEINQKMSDHLGLEYSAIYRTREDYMQLFLDIGLECRHEQNMFPEGHPLNKYPETRLRLYRFEKG
ncbi:Methyltransferase domain-containing protein [Roseovarius litoreus]|uniref:Methyltransferase domain-containing protein n=1 Tax=Roseovarius litoreus TaxID=1155722 RepID=A0A1M6ZZ94_9RHOB|nr:class I SAM-dependent methyltransferase [Roseovarius litoreus]SHL35643.1 Methyltransferase domain-containing protein [Roseovarius litoreus]